MGVLLGIRPIFPSSALLPYLYRLLGEYQQGLFRLWANTSVGGGAAARGSDLSVFATTGQNWIIRLGQMGLRTCGYSRYAAGKSLLQKGFSQRCPSLDKPLATAARPRSSAAPRGGQFPESTSSWLKPGPGRPVSRKRERLGGQV